MPPNERRRPVGRTGAESEATEHSITSSSYRLVQIRLAAVALGRHLELSPDRWHEAKAAFRIATAVADVTRQEAAR